MVFESLESSLSLDKSSFTKGLQQATASAQAFGGSASSAFDEVGDEADSAATSTNQLDSAASDLSGDMASLAVPTTLAANRLDEFGDEAGQAATKSNGAAASIGALRSSMLSTQAATAALGTAMTATAVPAVAALVASLGPLTATLGGVAAGAAGVVTGFGAIIGSGMLAYGTKLSKQNKQRLSEVKSRIKHLEKLEGTEKGLTAAQQSQLQTLKKQEQKLSEATTASGALSLKMKDLKSQIKQVVLPLGKQFVPLIEDAVAALPVLVQSIVQSLGPLGGFKSALRDLGQSAMTVIPRITGWLMDVGRKALPVVMDLAAWLGQNVPKAVSWAEQSVAQLWPKIVQLTSAFINMLGPLSRMGDTTANILVPALTSTIQSVTSAISWFNSLDTSVKQAATRFSLLAPAVAFVATKAVGLIGAISSLSTAFGGLGTAITVLSAPLAAAAAGVAAYVSNFAGLRTQVDRVASAISTAVDTIVNSYFAYLVADIKRTARAFGLFQTNVEASLRPIVKAVGTRLVGVVQSASSLIISAIWEMRKAWAQHGTAVLQTITQTYTTLSSLAQSKLATLGQITEAALGVIVNAYYGAWVDAQTSAKSLFAGLQSLFNARLTGLAEVSQSLLGLVVNAYYGAWGDARTSAENLFQDLQLVFTSGLSSLRPVAKSGLAALQATWARVETMLPRPIQSALSQIRGGVRSALTRIDALWTAHRETVVGAVRSGYRTLTTSLPSILSRIQGVVSGALTRLDRLWSAHGDLVVQVAQTGYRTLTTTLPSILSRVQSAVGGALSRLDRLWSAHGDTVLSTVRAGYRELTSTLPGVLSRVQSVVSGTLNRLDRLWAQHGTAITTEVTGLLQSVTRLFQARLRNLKAILTGVFSGVRGAWRRHGDQLLTTLGSTLRTLSQTTQRLLTGIAGAWQRHRGSIRRVARAVSSVITSTLLVGVEKLLGTTRRLLIQANALWTQHGDAIRQTLSQAASVAVPAVRTTLTTLRSVYETQLRGIGNQVSVWASQLQTRFSQVQSAVAPVANTALAHLQSAFQTLRPPVLALGGALLDVVSGSRSLRDMATQLWNRLSTLQTGVLKLGSVLGLTLVGKFAATQAAAAGLSGPLGMLGTWFGTRLPVNLTTLSTYFSSFISRLVSGASRVLGFGNTLRGLAMGGLSLVRSATVTLLPQVASLGSTIAGLAPSLGASSTALSGLGTVMTGLVGPIGILVAAVGGLALAVTTDMNEIERVSKGVASELKTYFIAQFRMLKKTAASVVDSLRTAVSATIQALKKQVIQPAKNMRTQFGQNIQQMKDEAGQTFRLILQIGRKYGRILGKFIRKTVSDMARIWAKHMSGSDGILANTRTTFNALWGNVIKPMLDLIQAAWKRWGDEILRFTRGAFDAIRVTISTAFDAILTLVNASLNILSGDVQGAWNNIAGFVERTAGRIHSFMKRWFPNFTATITGWLDTIERNYKNYTLTRVRQVKKAYNQISSFLTTWFPNFISDISSWLYTTRENFRKWGDRVYSDIQSTFNSIVSFFKTTAKTDIGSAVWGIMHTVQKHVQNLKKDVIAGGNSIIRSMISTVVTFFKNTAKTDIGTAAWVLFNSVWEQVDDLYGDVIGDKDSIINNMISGIASFFRNGAKSAVSGAISEVTSSIKSAFTDLSDDLIGNSTVPEMLNQIASYFKKDKAGIKKAVGGIVGDIRDRFESLKNKALETMSKIGSAAPGGGGGRTGVTARDVVDKFGEFDGGAMSQMLSNIAGTGRIHRLADWISQRKADISGYLNYTDDGGVDGFTGKGMNPFYGNRRYAERVLKQIMREGVTWDHDARLMSSVFDDIEGASSKLFSLHDQFTTAHTGGMVESDGLVNLQQGEEIIPAGEVDHNGGGSSAKARDEPLAVDVEVSFDAPEDSKMAAWMRENATVVIEQHEEKRSRAVDRARNGMNR